MKPYMQMEEVLRPLKASQDLMPIINDDLSRTTGVLSEGNKNDKPEPDNEKKAEERPNE